MFYENELTANAVESIDNLDQADLDAYVWQNVAEQALGEDVAHSYHDDVIRGVMEDVGLFIQANTEDEPEEEDVDLDDISTGVVVRAAEKVSNELQSGVVDDREPANIPDITDGVVQE